MTKAEFEMSEGFGNAKFIGENRQSVTVEYCDTPQIITCKVIAESGEERTFEIDEFLRLYGIYVALKASDIRPEIKQMEFLVEARAAITHLIENAKRKTQGKPLRKSYKFGGFIRSIDSHILMSKSELEGHLLESQIKTNQNTVSTNKTNRRLLLLTTIFTAVAVCVSIWGMRYTILNYERDVKSDSLEAKKDKSDSLLKKMESDKIRLQIENDRLHSYCDSIQNILEKT